MQYLDAHGLQVHFVLQLAHAARGSQERLGGDAAPVYAGASNVMALYHSCLETLQSHAECADQSAGTQERLLLGGNIS